MCSCACGWPMPRTERASASRCSLRSQTASVTLCALHPSVLSAQKYERADSLRPSQQRAAVHSTSTSGRYQPVRAWRAPPPAVASRSLLRVFPRLRVLRLGALSALHFRPHRSLRFMVGRVAPLATRLTRAKWNGKMRSRTLQCNIPDGRNGRGEV